MGRYDGSVLDYSKKYKDGPVEVAVSDPANVKSAIGNAGTYSDRDDVRFSLADGTSMESISERVRKVGELSFEAVVLDDGTRGYIQKQLMQAIGFKRTDRTPQKGRFLADFAPNYLQDIEKTDLPKTVKMPHGGWSHVRRLEPIRRHPPGPPSMAAAGQKRTYGDVQSRTSYPGCGFRLGGP